MPAMVNPPSIVVLVKWPDEPLYEYGLQGAPHNPIGPLLDRIWLDRCIRKGWVRYKQILPTEEQRFRYVQPSIKLLSEPPAYVVTRNDTTVEYPGNAPFFQATALKDAAITRETWFTLRRADTGE